MADDLTNTDALYGSDIPTEMPDTETVEPSTADAQGRAYSDPMAQQFQQESYASKEEQFAREQARAQEDQAGILELAGAAMEAEWVSSWFMRASDLSGFEPDPDFSLGDLDQEKKERLYGGLDADHLERFEDHFAEAVSWEHAQAIRENLDEVKANEEMLAEAGATGFGLRMLAAVGDPSVIALGAITGGLGSLAMWGSRLTKLQRAVRIGGVTAAENVAVESYLAQEDPFRTVDDVIIAGLAGFTIGGAAGALSKTPEAGLRAADEAIINQAVREGRASRTRPARAAQIDLEGDQVVSKVNAEDTPDAPDQGNSAGAAYANYVDDTLLESEENLVEIAKRDRPPKNAAKGEFNMRGRLFGSAHDVLAWGAERLFPTLHGRAGKGPAPVNAMDRSTRHFRSSMAKSYRQYLPAYKEWAKAQGLNGAQRWSGKGRDQFAEQVGRTIRDPNYTTDPHVQRAANALREINAEVLERAQRAGLHGFDEIPENPQYLMRVHSHDGLRKLEAKLGSVRLERLVSNAIMNGSEGIDSEAADLLASAYIGAVKRHQTRSDPFTGRLFAGNQARWLKEELQKMASEADADSPLRKLSEEDLDRLDDLVSGTASKETGKITRARRRLALNEAESMAAEDGTLVRLDEMFENNAEVIMESYLRQMSGSIGLAEAGFRRPDADFEKLVQTIENSGHRYGLHPDQVKSDLDALKAVHKMIMGRPLRDYNDAHRKAYGVMRSLRAYQFSRVMGQVGIAQIPDLAAAVGNFGFRNMMDQMPALRGVFRRMANGELDDELSAELEAVLAPGVDRLIDQPMGRYDDGQLDTLINTKLDRGLQRVNRMTSDVSLMHPIQMFAERMGARAAAQRLAREALGKGRKLSPQRLESMGLTGEIKDRVFDQLKKHSKWIEGGITGRRLGSLDLENWDDLAARERFLDAMHQWTRKAIQRNDPQDLMQIMHNDFAKLVMQFRTFSYVSWSKQLIHGVRMHDMETTLSFSASLMAGSLAYALKVHSNAPGRDDRDEYLEENLQPEKLALNGFYRSAWSSLLPMGIDTAMEAIGEDALFANARTTGLSTGILGNPTFDMLDKASSVMTDFPAAAFNPDVQLTQGNVRDLTSLILLQNIWGVQNALNAAVSDMPFYSER
jgi:hypothetical protein